MVALTPTGTSVMNAAMPSCIPTHNQAPVAWASALDRDLVVDQEHGTHRQRCLVAPLPQQAVRRASCRRRPIPGWAYSACEGTTTRLVACAQQASAGTHAVDPDPSLP